MGNGVFLVATGRNAKTGVTSLVLKTILNKPSASALDEMCQGIRDSFTNPVVKKSTDEDVKFLNFSARRFVYTVTQSGRSTYNEAILFVANGIGWTISSSGPQQQEADVKRILGMYKEKSP